VRETAPATPPAMKDATTGFEIALRKLVGTTAVVRSDVAAMIILAALREWLCCPKDGFGIAQERI